MRKEVEGYDRQLAAPSAVDEETRQAMIALGYVGSGASASQGPLPAPRRKIGSLADLKEGFRLNAAKDFSGGRGRFPAGDRREPQDGGRLGIPRPRPASRRPLRRRRWPLTSEALKISNGSPQVAVAAASLYFDLGRLDDAAAHAKMALATHSSFAHGLLAADRPPAQAARRGGARGAGGHGG